eukprot:scaffold79846_cov75-Phaeocystis_antarctica.AAC.4
MAASKDVASSDGRLQHHCVPEWTAVALIPSRRHDEGAVCCVVGYVLRRWWRVGHPFSAHGRFTEWKRLAFPRQSRRRQADRRRQ